MSGPIVRTGTTPAFWENWDRVFKGKKRAAGAAGSKKAAARKPAKSAKPKPSRGKKKK